MHPGAGSAAPVIISTDICARPAARLCKVFDSSKSPSKGARKKCKQWVRKVSGGRSAPLLKIMAPPLPTASAMPWI